jgi:hypothetical protein
MSHSSSNGELLLMALMAVLIVRVLRQFLNIPSRLAAWDKALGRIWVPAVVLAIADQLVKFPTSMLDESYWLFVLAVFGGVLVLLRDYRPARTLLLALGPYALYTTIEYVLEASSRTLLKQYDDALATTQGFVIIWLVTFVFIARSQKKQLENERLLREEEERAKRLIEAQNAELERLVAERTAALTHQAEKLRAALTELRATQAQLVQSEKWPAWVNSRLALPTKFRTHSTSSTTLPT